MEHSKLAEQKRYNSNKVSNQAVWLGDFNHWPSQEASSSDMA